METKHVTGILWWKPKQWEKAKRICTDAENFDETYQDWKEAAEKALENFQLLGLTVYKIEVNLDEMVKWCKAQKLPLSAQARSRYVSMLVEKRNN
jgi:hypothetical protein